MHLYASSLLLWRTNHNHNPAVTVTVTMDTDWRSRQNTRTHSRSLLMMPIAQLRRKGCQVVHTTLHKERGCRSSCQQWIRSQHPGLNIVCIYYNIDYQLFSTMNTCFVLVNISQTQTLVYTGQLSFRIVATLYNLYLSLCLSHLVDTLYVVKCQPIILFSEPYIIYVISFAIQIYGS